jgi:hypothetical protein
MDKSDVHKALLFDQLHAYGGLWDDHLWAEAKFQVNKLGKSFAALVDKQHVFSSIQNSSF